jgi:signal transduction histidine kinase
VTDGVTDRDDRNGARALGRFDLYRTYWDASADGLFAVEVTPQGSFLCAGLNPVLEAATGLDSRQTRGREPTEYLDAHAAGELTGLYRECLAAEAPITRSLILELPSGVRVCDISLVPVHEAPGRIKLLLGRVQDITDLEMIGAGRSAQGLLRDVLSSLSTHLGVLDRTGRIVLVNEAWRTFDLERGTDECVVGANYIEVCASLAARGSTAAARLRDGLLKVRDGRSRRFSHVYRFDGSSIYQMRATRFDRGSEMWIVVTHDDVTAATEAQQQVSTLTERLLDIQEEERQRIALELHDSTSQHLVAVQLGLAALSQGRATDQTLADMREELKEAHREIRTLSYLLHPPRLAAERLEATLQQFVDGFQRRTGATVELDLEGSIDKTPFPVQRAVFRVIQEALANAHKHGRAQKISVQLSRRENGLQLDIGDDGQSPPLQIVPGIGVPGMEARIERFGGVLSVTPTVSGTRVSAFIPAEALDETTDDERPRSGRATLGAASTSA